MNSDIPVSVRLNPFKKPSEPLPILEGASGVPWNGYGYILKERPVFTLHPLFHAGCYYVQDSSAMYVGHIFRKCIRGMAGPLRVLDLCAAPGGKTTDLAASLREQYGNGFILVSNEVMKQRAAVLYDNVVRWGDPNVIVTSADPAAFAHLEGFFDVVVADVPCSGEGMFRKDERAREEWSPEVVKLCASRQKRILADMWPCLKKGGLLIYSTCTYEKEENDDNLEWAASELGGEIVRPENEFSSSGVGLTDHGNLLVAGQVPGEGQWVGALVKNSGVQARTSAVLESVVKPFRVREEGFDVDECLKIDFDRDRFPCVEVDKPTALKFLHRDSLVLPDAEKGYNVLTYKGIPLGFVKNIGSRCNNLLPKARRIMMNI